MLFNSAEFLLLFLPAVVAGYYLLLRIAPGHVAIAFLALASVFFYGHWNVAFLPVLLVSLAVNYVAGYVLGHLSDAQARTRLWLTAAGIVFNLVMLLYYKYTNFMLDTLREGFGLSVDYATVVLPIGISFFTFQQMAFLVDSYRRGTHEGDFARYCLFIAFFPQLIAGPIVHHREMMPQFRGSSPGLLFENLSIGLTVFAAGLFKKIAIADPVAAYSSNVFDQVSLTGAQPGFAAAWAATLCYSFQIYFDFSAYSDMAVGLGRMFGIRLPINFASPYQATSMIDFWRRWHITLSRFLRDYVYFSLGGGRAGMARRYGNIFLTMVIGGVWHGAGWTFLLWGLLHGALIVINHVWRDRVVPALGWMVWPWIARGLTLLCVVLAWVPFRAADLETTSRIYRGMLGLVPACITDMPGPCESVVSAPKAGVWLGLVLLTGWVLWLPNIYQIMRSTHLSLASPHYPATQVAAMPPGRLVWRPNFLFALAVAVILLLCLLRIHDVSEFIYFQF